MFRNQRYPLMGTTKGPAELVAQRAPSGYLQVCGSGLPFVTVISSRHLGQSVTKVACSPRGFPI